MRTTYAVGIVVLVAAVVLAFALNRAFTPQDNTADTTLPSTSSLPFAMSSTTLTLLSSAFENNASIPSRFTCDAPPAGGQVNPPLAIAGVPAEAKTLALIMDDPDVPKALRPDGVFDHWILFNISPQTREIAIGMTVGMVGKNSAGKNEYAGPCPPPQYEPSEHRYVFTLYALDTELPLAAGASKADVLAAMEGHILAKAQLIGRYKRQ